MNKKSNTFSSEDDGAERADSVRLGQDDIGPLHGGDGDLAAVGGAAEASGGSARGSGVLVAGEDGPAVGSVVRTRVHRGQFEAGCGESQAHRRYASIFIFIFKFCIFFSFLC